MRSVEPDSQPKVRAMKSLCLMTVSEFQKRRFSEVPQRSSARYTLSNTEKDPASFGQQRVLVYAGGNKREGIKIKKGATVAQKKYKSPLEFQISS